MKAKVNIISIIVILVILISFLLSIYDMNNNSKKTVAGIETESIFHNK